MRKLLVTAAAGVLGLLSLAAPANAVLQLDSVVNGSPFHCVDNTACDTNPAVGVLAIGNQNFGGVLLNGSVQIQTIGASNILNTSSLTLTNTTGSTTHIAVAVGGTNFVGPNNNFDASASATFQSDIGGNLHVQFYDDPTNQQGADAINDLPGNLVAEATKNVTLVADSFSFNSVGLVNDPGLFSMTLFAEGDVVAGGSVISRGQTLLKAEAVPEPGTLLIFGSALGAMFLVTRRRKPAGDDTNLPAVAA